jgi:hypothetical protein
VGRLWGKLVWKFGPKLLDLGSMIDCEILPCPALHVPVRISFKRLLAVASVVRSARGRSKWLGLQQPGQLVGMQHARLQSASPGFYPKC